MIKRFYGIVIFVLFLTGCQNNEKVKLNPMDRLPDNQAGQVDSSGAVVRSVKQLHKYNLGDRFQARMTWSKDSSNYTIINDGEQAKKYKEGVELTDDKSKKEAWNSSYGSHYVIGMPYKLTDPGVTLSYEGVDETLLDRPVHSIKVEYAKDAGSSGGMHKWWYYFDKENYDLVANYMDYGNKYSLTTYEVFEDVDGMRFHNKRFSYQSNEKRERVQLKTIYENEEMKFDQAFEKDVFTLK